MSRNFHQLINAIKLRLSRSWLPIVIILAASLIFLSLIFMASNSMGIPGGNFTRDIDAIVEVPWYTGSVTYLGLMMWAAATAFCLFGASALHDRSRKYWFLLSSGVLTVFLALDDALQIHEEVVPTYLHMDEKVVYALYLVLLAGILIYFLKEIWNETDFPFLAASLGFMGLSILVDAASEMIFLEDCCKFVGIIFWMAYFFTTAMNFVKARMHLIEVNK